MALPSLPALPSLSERPQLQRSPLQLVASPSGNGWGFSPDGGWGLDSSGIGPNGSGFIFGGGGGSGGQTGGNSGPGYGWDVIFGGGPTGVALGTAAGVVGNLTGGAAQTGSIFPSINWGRIGAFLLGLLLIAGGLYLIKPVQQVVNRTGKELAKGLVEE